ncbi:MAG: carbohydrate ABC transporter substrate-binding protein [Rhodospirillaceae bacterium]|nr:carbohydrate ABC transporter substrate-binding protein [Rhodospirillaceae bacterium]
MAHIRALSTAVAIGGLVALGSAPAAAQTAEVLHYWTSGGEARAVAALQQEFEAAGGTWIDSPVAGGGGDAQATVLRARVLAGDPPTAVQIKGPNIQDWAAEGALANLDEVAAAEGWDEILPPLLRDIVTYEGHYVAVPVNIHRVNWLWVNPALLEQAGVAVPTTWDEFNAAADALLAAGITPLAHGGQPWQDATVFETVVLGLGGADFYRQALVDLDPDALTSDTMIAVFEQMRRLSGYVDPNFPGREWNLATRMVMNGEAAMQIMGDWAKGEFAAAELQPGSDYLCVPTPGAAGYILNSDSFAFFKVEGEDRIAGQRLLASLILGTDFQETFNLFKGSIPARNDVPPDAFDACAVRSMDDLAQAVAADSLVPSMAHEIAIGRAARGAFLDVVTEHFNSDMTAEEAVERLVEEVELAQ